MSEPTPPRRRCFQFGIGTMVLLVTVFAVLFAWELSYIRVRQAIRQRIENEGGTVHTLADWHFQKPSDRSIAYGSGEIPIWRRWLRDEGVERIVLRGATEEEHCEAVERFPEAYVVYMDQPR